MLRVLLLENIHSSSVQYLKDYYGDNITIDSRKTSIPESELKLVLQEFDVIGIRSRTKLTKEVLEANKHLLMICCFCIGTNQVNLEVARELMIPVFNSPYMNTRSVAELVISHVIALSRQSYHHNSQMHQGHWQKSSTNCYEVRGKRIGIIGYGHVGSQVATLAESLGMKVGFYDVVPVLPLSNSTSMSLHQLLETSDFITLHVPLSEATRNFIGEDELSHFKKGSYLINTSRGNVVDIPSLKKYLDNDTLAGCALDVYPNEPSGNNCSWKFDLQGYPNVILTPHIGGATEEAQEQIGLDVASKIVSYHDYGSTFGSVNFPEVTSNQQFKNGGVLIMILHPNVPGHLSKINQLFGNLNINVDKQILSTYKSTGYLLMKVKKPNTEAEEYLFQSLIESLKQISKDIKISVKK